MSEILIGVLLNFRSSGGCGRNFFFEIGKLSFIFENVYRGFILCAVFG